MKTRFASAACLLAMLASGTLRCEVRITPTPQYLESLNHSIMVSKQSEVAILLGSPGADDDPKMNLAAGFLRDVLQQGGAAVSVRGANQKPTSAAVYLWNWAAGQNPPIPLNLLDRQTLSDSRHWGQSYVIRSLDAASIWAIGSSDQGVLLAAMTILQSIRSVAGGVEISGLYVRDYPDFEFRTASDWLLNGEVNRWSMDQGQGIEAYRKLVKLKLDHALRFKINMVLIDGFGWGLKQRFNGYAGLMRDLNIYARARGIHLLYGGYGASYGIAYQTGPIYEEGAYLGEIFKNRKSYPDGPIYRCMGFDRGKKEVDPATLGSCRSNQELNKLKAEELRQFVEAVEPGALYIHHEDFGNYRRTQEMWLKRCDRCRKRWPNDTLKASDGGAGGLANGYGALVRAINSVKNPATGYDAGRDCQVVLISPVYHPDSSEADAWADALELWRNIGAQLPRSANVEVGFREVFPLKHGQERFTDDFNRTMKAAGLNLGLFLYFAGGTDDWVSDYPLTGVPAMNGLFRGATTMYDGTGDFYRAPMEIIAAEYSWNYRSTGFFADPQTVDETRDIWRKYIFGENQPVEIFGSGKLYDRVCDLLYGPQAGPIMASYYRESAELPDTATSGSNRTLGNGYLPMGWNRVYGLPTHWRALALDSKTWGREISNEAYAAVVARMQIDRKELHRRLARRWSIGAGLNQKAAADIQNALTANPLPESVEDLRFFATALRVYQPLIDALAEYHSGLEAHFSNPKDAPRIRASFAAALTRAKDAQTQAAAAFPQPVDPVGGDVGAIRKYTDILVAAIQRMQMME